MGYLDAPTAGGGGGGGGAGAWTLVSHGTTDINMVLADLDGDTDEIYKLILRMDNATGGMDFGVSFNAFSGGSSDYRNVGVYTNDSGTTAVQNFLATNSMKFFPATNCHSLLLEMTLYVASGTVRTAHSTMALTRIPQTNETYNVNMAHTWADTTTNITSLHLVDFSGAGSPTGKYWLYKAS